jgi:hypothetical protein
MQSIPDSRRAKVWNSFLHSYGYLGRETFLAFIPLFLPIVCGALFLEEIGVVAFVLFATAGAFASAAFYVAQMRKPFREFLARSV